MNMELIYKHSDNIVMALLSSKINRLDTILCRIVSHSLKCGNSINTIVHTMTMSHIPIVLLLQLFQD